MNTTDTILSEMGVFNKQKEMKKRDKMDLRQILQTDEVQQTLNTGVPEKESKRTDRVTTLHKKAFLK